MNQNTASKIFWDTVYLLVCMVSFNCGDGCKFKNISIIYQWVWSIIVILYFFYFQKRAQTHTSSIAREMATVLDTSLLQALILTGQSSGAIELLKGLNYCDLKICEEFLKERSEYMVLLELYKSNEMHREALRLLNQLVEESKSEMENTDFNKKFNPQMILEYLRVLFLCPLLTCSSNDPQISYIPCYMVFYLSA